MKRGRVKGPRASSLHTKIMKATAKISTVYIFSLFISLKWMKNGINYIDVPWGIASNSTLLTIFCFDKCGVFPRTVGDCETIT